MYSLKLSHEFLGSISFIIFKILIFDLRHFFINDAMHIFYHLILKYI